MDAGSVSPYAFDEDGRLKTRGTETYQYNAAGQRTSADMTGDTPDPAYGYDGDQKLVKYSENGTVKNYHLMSSVLGATITDLTASGAVDTAYILESNGSQIASVHSNVVSIKYTEPLSQDQRNMAMDKTSLGGPTYDPLGRSTGYGYTGGGPCFNNCPAPYNPPGGIDGLAILQSLQLRERWQDTVFWNLRDYINLGIPVTSDPPTNWDPTHDNLNRISDYHVFIPPGSLGEGGSYIPDSDGIARYGLGIFSIQFEGPPGQRPDDPNRLPDRSESKRIKNGFVDSALDYLNRNKECETFLNSLLGQLYTDSGIQSKGSIQDLLEAFRNDGTLRLDFSNIKSGLSQMADGDTDPTTRKIHLNLSSYGGLDSIRIKSNILTFIHEVIHANGGGLFTDEAIARATAHLGYTMTPEEYIQSFPGRVTRSGPKYPPVIQASYDLAGYSPGYFCDPRGLPPGIKKGL